MTGWRGALETLERREKVKEVLERQKRDRQELVKNKHEKYLESRLCPIQKPAGGKSMMVRIKQDRGPTMGRTRGPAHPQRTHSMSVNPASILGIAYSPTARSMNAVKGSDLVEEHPWRLLAMCGSHDRALNVAAIHAIKSIGREKMCNALAGGYSELIEKILGEIQDPVAEIRAAMAQALGALAIKGDEKVIDELILASDDEDDYVRASALSSLALIAHRESSSDRCTTVPVQTALARMNDGDPDVREAAVLAVGALAPIGDKLGVETVLHALEDTNPTVNAAAVDGLILLGDVYELEDGDNQLLEISDVVVRLYPQVADSAKLLGGDEKPLENWVLIASIEPEVKMKGTSGPVQALQYWVTLFGVHDFELRAKGCLQDGRSKLLALVEDTFTVIEGDIETVGRLVFWWPAAARRVLFQTSSDWAWEYRKQCRYLQGYSYIDADTGEELFGSDFTFDKYFFVECDQNMCTIFLKGIRGGIRQELAKFAKPNAAQHQIVRRVVSGGETAVKIAELECTHTFEMDTDVLGGCSALLVLRLIHDVNPERCPPPTCASSASVSTADLAEDTRHKTLSTIVPLSKTGSKPMQISHALLAESDLTWYEDLLTLIDPEENLGERNDKRRDNNNLQNISCLPPDRAHIFSGILARLENENLAVRNAAIEAIHNFIGFGNHDAVEGVLRRLQHPELNVRAAAVTALKAVAEVGHSRALQGCLDRMQSQEPFVRAASLEAFCAICPSADARITEVLEKMIDDGDVFVRTTADILLNDFKKSRKAKDWEASEASRRILDDHEYYHHWHATERAFVIAQQGSSHVYSKKCVKSDLVSIESDRTKSSSQEQDNSTQLAAVKERHQDKLQSMVAFEDSTGSATKDDAVEDSGNGQSARETLVKPG